MANKLDYEFQDMELEKSEAGDLNLSFNLKPTIKRDTNVYFEYFIEFLRNGVVIRVTIPVIERLEPDNDLISVWINEQFNKDITPDSYQLIYREFLINKNMNFELNCPPEINKNCK